VLREQEDKVTETHGDHGHRLVPHDHIVGGDGCQHGNGRRVHAAVPDQRPFFHGDGPPVAGCQARARRHAKCVVHAAAHHRAHAEVGLGREGSDHGDDELGCACRCRHECRPGHVRRNSHI